MAGVPQGTHSEQDKCDGTLKRNTEHEKELGQFRQCQVAFRMEGNTEVQS